MSINASQLRELIEDTLEKIGLYSPDAVELLMMTAATESHLGTYIEQISGPALGIFQMEPRTHKDLWDWVDERANYRDKLMEVSQVTKFDDFQLKGNLIYAIIMARYYYRRVPTSLPTTVEGMAEYYKKYWNTHLGKATVEGAIQDYNHYCGYGSTAA